MFNTPGFLPIFLRVSTRCQWEGAVRLSLDQQYSVSPSDGLHPSWPGQWDQRSRERSETPTNLQENHSLESSQMEPFIQPLTRHPKSGIYWRYRAYRYPVVDVPGSSTGIYDYQPRFHYWSICLIFNPDLTIRNKTSNQTRKKEGRKAKQSSMNILIYTYLIPFSFRVSLISVHFNFRPSRPKISYCSPFIFAPF